MEKNMSLPKMSLDEIEIEIPKLLNEIQENMFQQAKDFLNKNTFKTL